MNSVFRNCVYDTLRLLINVIAYTVRKGSFTAPTSASELSRVYLAVSVTSYDAPKSDAPFGDLITCIVDIPGTTRADIRHTLKLRPGINRRPHIPFRGVAGTSMQSRKSKAAGFTMEGTWYPGTCPAITRRNANGMTCTCDVRGYCGARGPLRTSVDPQLPPPHEAQGGGRRCQFRPRRISIKHLDLLRAQISFVVPLATLDWAKVWANMSHPPSRVSWVLVAGG